ncbi:hypothetical protein [Moorena producens]
MIRRKASDFPPLRAWDRQSRNAPPGYSLLPTPYSLLPTPYSLCYRLYI